MKNLALTILISVPLVACGRSPNDGTNPDAGSNGLTDNGSGGDGGSSIAALREGLWDYSEYTAVQNDCALESLAGNGDGGFGIVDDDAEHFTVYPGDGSDPFACSRSGSSVSCPNRGETREDLHDSGFDAVLSGRVSVDATVVDAETLDGQQQALIQCAGTDCATLATIRGTAFPCRIRVRFSGIYHQGTRAADVLAAYQASGGAQNEGGTSAGGGGESGGSTGGTSEGGGESGGSTGGTTGGGGESGGSTGGTTGGGGESEGSTGGSTGGGGENEGGTSSGASPLSGLWDYGEYTPVSSSCNYDRVAGNGSGGFDLTNHGNGSMTIVPGDGTDAFACTQSGDAIHCPKRLTVLEDFTNEGLDAKLLGNVSVDASVLSETGISGQQNGDVTCAGSDCALVALSVGASFPCAFQVRFASNWRMP